MPLSRARRPAHAACRRSRSPLGAGRRASLTAATTAALTAAGLLLGPPLIGFGADTIGLRMALATLVLLALVVFGLARRVVPSFV